MATVIDAAPSTVRPWRIAPETAVLAVPVVVACAVATAPLAVSIGAVLVCAGPHNLQEARYFLRRLPARLGRLKTFFALGCGGTVLLAAAFVAVVWAARTERLVGESLHVTLASWSTAAVAWVAGLAWLRSRTPPRRDWRWLVPAALGLIAAAWAAPLLFSVGLVYLHPVLALVFLDRELRRRRSPWRAALQRVAWLVPACVAGLVFMASRLPSLPEDDLLARQIAGHVGAGVVPLVSVRGLVTVHAFLELLHYATWIVAIPAAAALPASWHVDAAPLARRSPRWRRGLRAAVAVGGLVVVGLWGWFLADYAVARDVYFTVAIVHVLAEFPMLLRTA